MSTDYNDTVSNRSEIVLLTDARRANPNGDPRSHENKPRRDDENIGVITDSRHKRYLRDELTENEEDLSVLLENPKFIDEGVSTREELYQQLLDMTGEELEEADPEELRDRFLERATDVRYFGATVSLQNDEEAPGIKHLRNSLKSQYIGPVQFMHGESLHPVFLNDESSKLAITLSSNEENEQGTFASDHRINYGVYRFYGVVNENAAEDTRLTETDVERLDETVWRSWKNQTLTRSKLGQEPRLWVRVEHETDNYHIGPDLQLGLQLADEAGDPRELADITDATLDASVFMDLIADAADRIKAVHIVESPLLEYADRKSLTESLTELLGAEQVNEPDPQATSEAA